MSVNGMECFIHLNPDISLAANMLTLPMKCKCMKINQLLEQVRCLDS